MTHNSQPGIVKKVLHAGKPGMPDYVKDTRVLFHYEVLSPKVDTTKQAFPQARDQFVSVDDSRKQWPKGYGEPLELVIGRKFQLPVMETCIKSMQVNEISQFDIEARQMLSFPMVAKKLRDIARAKIDPKFEESHTHHCAGMGIPKTGYDELDELMENPKDLRVVINLLKVEQPSEYSADNWQLDNTARLSKVEQLKTTANEEVKKGALDLAIDDYRQAVTLLDQLLLMEKPGEPEWNELNEKLVPLYANLAHCYLNQHKYREAENAASEALKRCESHEKSLFRRYKARTALYEFDEAEDDLNTLLDKHPQSQGLVTAEMAKLSLARKENKDNQSQLYKKMVAK